MSAHNVEEIYLQTAQKCRRKCDYVGEIDCNLAACQRLESQTRHQVHPDPAAETLSPHIT